MLILSYACNVHVALAVNTETLDCSIDVRAESALLLKLNWLH